MRLLNSVVLLFCCSTLAAQSLTELAKKETERRKANADAGKIAVVDAEGGPGDTRDPKRAEPKTATFEARRTPVSPDEAIEELEERAKKLGSSYESERARCSADSARLKDSGGSIPSCIKAQKLLLELRAANDRRSKLVRQRFWRRYNNGEIKPKKQ